MKPRLRNRIYLALLCLFLTLLSKDSRNFHYPKPTEVLLSESTQNARSRLDWFQLMHQSAPGTNWRSIELQNQKAFHKSSALDWRSDCGLDFFADGQIKASWFEKGSSNQAGSVYETAYLPQTDEIWLISAGGSLLKRSRTESNWQVINQDIRFDRGFLEFIPMGNQIRLSAFINAWPHYSDDLGQSWHAAKAESSISSGGYAEGMLYIPGPKPIIAFLFKPQYYSNFELWVSSDAGQTAQKIRSLDEYFPGHYTLNNPAGSNDLLFFSKNAENQVQTFGFDPVQSQLSLLNTSTSFPVKDANLNIQSLIIQDTLHLYTYQYDRENKSTQLMLSKDTGESWVEIGVLPELPWEHTFFISPSQPNIMYMGAVEAYQSTDGGQNWELINYWWEYYEDINTKLHADIMHIAEFEDKSGEVFTLISNHGGLSISYDQFSSQENIGLNQLNVSQYYSVRTSPIDPSIIYAGSQDQGLQATLQGDQESILAFEQLISGDFGHLVFTNGGRSLWAVYPGAWIFYFDDVNEGLLSASLDVNAENQNVWLPPLHASPNTSENVVYLAGGSAEEGLGSYLVRLSYEDGSIHAENLPYDFFDASIDGTISAIEIAPRDSNYWYVATTNGRLFYSHDGAKSWKENINFIPQGEYLYGQTLLASKKDPRKLYLGGSGYSNPPIYYSEDGGMNFVDKSMGLPPTLVYDLSFNEEETMLFAATEAGPFVYLTAEQTWHSLANPCSPNQIYWSVEYLNTQDIVRFGTYGRGIWDFKIEALTPTSASSSIDLANQISIYPNPSTQFFRVVSPELPKRSSFKILNTQGETLQQGVLKDSSFDIDLGRFPAGIYFLNITTPSGIYSKRLIKTQ